MKVCEDIKALFCVCVCVCVWNMLNSVISITWNEKKKIKDKNINNALL